MPYKTVITNKDMTKTVYLCRDLVNAREVLDRFVIRPAKEAIKDLDILHTLKEEKYSKRSKTIYSHQLPYDLTTGDNYYALNIEKQFVIGGVIISSKEEGYTDLKADKIFDEIES